MRMAPAQTSAPRWCHTHVVSEVVIVACSNEWEGAWRTRAKALEAIHSPPVGSKPFTSSTKQLVLKVFDRTLESHPVTELVGNKPATGDQVRSLCGSEVRILLRN